MIQDQDTNLVYLSAQLQTRYCDFFTRFTHLLDEMDIEWKLIPHTRDIWARDYMPIQLSTGEYLMYQYDPDYLDNPYYRDTKTDPREACQALGIQCSSTPIILDGGNVTPCGDYLVMTDKVFTENGKEKDDLDFLHLLETTLHHPIIILPWHCLNPDDEDADVYGHSDGFIHQCEDGTVLMTNHRHADLYETEQIKSILQSYDFQVVELLFPEVANPDYNWNWAYVNYLQVGHNIIVPSFGIPEDRLALQIIQSHNPNCRVRSIRMRDIAANGGALHCISWNVRR